MAWVLFNAPRLEQVGALDVELSHAVFGKAKVNFAMHRGPVPRHRPLYPLPLGEFEKVKQLAKSAVLEDFVGQHFADLSTEEVWTALEVLGLNGVAGFGRADLQRRPTELQQRALKNLQASTKRVLNDGVNLDRDALAAEKELSTRFVSYSGEELPKMQILTIAGAKPALPPESHGGSIDARGLLSEGSTARKCISY